MAGKQSARYFQFGLAQHFLLCGESGLVAFFDEREARPQPEPVPRNKQWRELLTKRLEYWRPNASLIDVSITQLRSNLCTDVPPPLAKRLVKNVGI